MGASVAQRLNGHLKVRAAVHHPIIGRWCVSCCLASSASGNRLLRCAPCHVALSWGGASRQNVPYVPLVIFCGLSTVNSLRRSKGTWQSIHLYCHPLLKPWLRSGRHPLHRDVARLGRARQCYRTVTTCVHSKEPAPSSNGLRDAIRNSTVRFGTVRV